MERWKTNERAHNIKIRASQKIAGGIGIKSITVERGILEET